jgi:predicted anti-sigma-YlaC factor YlaD
MHDVQPIECERTRRWISAALDSDPSQFERALVAAHLEGCPSCKGFETRVVALTDALRNAPPARLSSRITLPRRRTPVWSSARIARIGSAAAATAAVAWLGVLSLPERQDPLGESALVGAPLARPASVNDLVLEVRRPTLRLRHHQALAHGAGGIGATKPPLSPTS